MVPWDKEDVKENSDVAWLVSTVLYEGSCKALGCCDMIRISSIQAVAPREAGAGPFSWRTKR